MSISYTQIDQDLRPYYLKLEERGIPIDKDLLSEDLVFIQGDLCQLKQAINKEVGFIPNLLSVNDWIKVYELKHDPIKFGYQVKSKTELLKRLFLEHQDSTPVFKLCLEASDLQKKFRGFEGIKQRVQRSTSTIHPVYRIHPNLGRIYTSDPNLLGWDRSFRKYVRKPNHYIVEATYNLLEVRALQRLSRDSTLEVDLRDDSSAYTVMARRLFGVYDISDSQKIITKIALHTLVTCQSGEAIHNSVNSYLVRSNLVDKLISSKQAHDLLKKWGEIYPEASEYLGNAKLLYSKTHEMKSYYGRTPDYEKFSSQFGSYGILATAADVANLGFRNVFQDHRLSALKALPITTVFDSIILEVPNETDFDLVKNYLEEDLLSADSDFTLRVDISQGDSWSDC